MSLNEIQTFEENNILGSKKDTPIDLNLIESAMFSRNKNATKLKEVHLDNLNILIRSVKDHTIPNSFDEDVFFAILHLLIKYKEVWNLDYIPRTIYLTYSDLCSLLNLGTQYIDRVRISLDKLASTSYKLTNSFLSRDISPKLFNFNELTPNEIKKINLASTVIIFNNQVYNKINFTKSKIKTFIFTPSQLEFDKLTRQINLDKNNICETLSKILDTNNFTQVHDTTEKKLNHLLDIFNNYVIKNMKLLVDEDELLSDIRSNIDGIKISDFSIKKNMVTSTFNLINFMEFSINEMPINEMLNGAKLNADNYPVVKKFLESKVKRKSKFMLRIDINNYMYENIINKVYLKHSLSYLLDFTDKTARALYLYMEANKGLDVRQKKKNVVKLRDPNRIIVGVELLAEYIMLSLNSKTISNTVSILKRSMEYLRANGYIKNYIDHRESPLILSYFVVEFHIQQNRNHPQYMNYSIKVLPLPGIESKSAEMIQDIFKNIPDQTKADILSINHITEENIDALVTLYKNNEDKSVIVNEKVLNRNQGALMVKAIVNKINRTPGIRSVSAYLYKTISTPTIYAEDLIKLKQEEYDSLYGVKALQKEKLEKERLKEENKALQLEEMFKNSRSIINEKWELLPQNEKEEFIIKANKIIKNKEIHPQIHELLPKAIFGKDKLDLYYSSILKLTLNNLGIFNK